MAEYPLNPRTPPHDGLVMISPYSEYFARCNEIQDLERLRPASSEIPNVDERIAMRRIVQRREQVSIYG